jgi:uncharacterized membrane protein
MEAMTEQGQPDQATEGGGPDAWPAGHPAKPGWPGPRLPHAAEPWQWVHRAEHLASLYAQGIPVPAWLRTTRGEHRWPVTLSVIAAIVLQVLLPPHLTQPLPRSLLPSLEGALLVGLSIANPVRIERRGKFVRAASIALILLISVANAASAALLIRAILATKGANAAGPLLATGASVWTTNVIAFALWYWEFDRGGPVNRATATSRFPDFLFPQMATPTLAPVDWEPRFVDYLYLSFTNASAFSPTDVMPLARWAKLTMLVQSAVSLSIGALVIARAVNIL